MTNSVSVLIWGCLGSVSGTSEGLRTIEGEKTTGKFLPGGDQAWESGKRML